MTAKSQTKAQKAKTGKATKPDGTKGTVRKKDPKNQARKARFDVEFYRDWCKGCGICVAFCSGEALSMNDRGEPEISKPELCIGCTWCEIRCPDFCITVRKKAEEADET